MREAEASSRPEGPIEAAVVEQWERIFELISDGNGVAVQIQQILEFIDYHEREVLSGVPTEDQKMDLHMARFVHKFNLESELPKVSKIRENRIEFARQFSNRLNQTSDDITKFLIKTVILAHGAVSIAAFAAISQTNQVFIVWFATVLIAVSGFGIFFVGAGCAHFNI